MEQKSIPDIVVAGCQFTCVLWQRMAEDNQRLTSSQE